MQMKAWRKDEGLTLDQVAERLKNLGVETTGISVGRYERFDRMPDRGMIKAIILLTDGAVTANDFLDLPQEPETAA